MEEHDKYLDSEYLPNEDRKNVLRWLGACVRDDTVEEELL